LQAPRARQQPGWPLRVSLIPLLRGLRFQLLWVPAWPVGRSNSSGLVLPRSSIKDRQSVTKAPNADCDSSRAFELVAILPRPGLCYLLYLAVFVDSIVFGAVYLKVLALCVLLFFVVLHATDRGSVTLADRKVRIRGRAWLSLRYADIRSADTKETHHGRTGVLRLIYGQARLIRTVKLTLNRRMLLVSNVAVPVPRWCATLYLPLRADQVEGFVSEVNQRIGSV